MDEVFFVMLVPLIVGQPNNTIFEHWGGGELRLRKAKRGNYRTCYFELNIYLRQNHISSLSHHTWVMGTFCGTF